MSDQTTTPDEHCFDEQSLRADIVRVWGEHGAHIDVFDHMLRRVRPLPDEEQRREVAERLTQWIAAVESAKYVERGYESEDHVNDVALAAAFLTEGPTP